MNDMINNGVSNKLIKDYESKEIYGGVVAVIHFTNGYSASCISHQYSYGGREGLWELAVMVDGIIVYDTPVTNDVLGHLPEEEIDALLVQIANLPPPELSTIDCDEGYVLDCAD